MINAPLPLRKNRINLGLTKSGLGMSAEPHCAISDLLSQMTAALNSPQIDFSARREAIRDLSIRIVAQTKCQSLPMPEPVRVNWVGSTMVV